MASVYSWMFLFISSLFSSDMLENRDISTSKAAGEALHSMIWCSYLWGVTFSWKHATRCNTDPYKDSPAVSYKSVLYHCSHITFNKYEYIHTTNTHALIHLSCGPACYFSSRWPLRLYVLNMWLLKTQHVQIQLSNGTVTSVRWNLCAWFSSLFSRN